MFQNNTLKLVVKRTIIAMLFLGSIALAVLLYFFEPVKGGIYPPCSFNYLTGFYCPGCGTLRVLHSIVHGDFIKAVDYNVLTVILLPIAAYIFISELDINIKGRPLLKKLRMGKSFAITLVTVILVFWLLRNINIYPLNILAP